MKRALAILHFLRDCAKRGERAVLVTLTDVTGSAARAPGEHMAVAESGQYVGSFSGGCVEAAVVAEAQEVLSDGRSRHVRYGDGSRYIDIRLPCGGGIDLLFTPIPDPRQIDHAAALLEQRAPAMLHLTIDGGLWVAPAGEDDRTMWHDAVFAVRHDPVLRLVVIGHGAEPAAMLDIARAYGADAMVLSPQASLIHDSREKGFAADLLHFVGRAPSLSVDPWTAVVALFHDHDWETELLLQVMDQNPFFIGAMGSKRTHAERRRRLADAGALEDDIDRIIGPVGLIKATRDPQTLALSIMAQIVSAYEAATARGNHGPAAGSMNNSHVRIEESAPSNWTSAALSTSRNTDVDQTIPTDAWRGRKEDQVHVGHI